jgi:hypothetical protein
MYFYIDESGNTGPNLFDANQPVLSYGILSARVNIDALAEPFVAPLRKRLGVERLHANELGMGRLASIGDELSAVQKKLDLRFDVCFLEKIDHAYFQFFDQLFDQGSNKAVPWIAYWTPLRYVTLLHARSLFDEPLLKRAWEIRIDRNAQRATANFVALCRDLKERLNRIADERVRQITHDALAWAIADPASISYNVADTSQQLWVSPNLVGFQSVLSMIAIRLRKADVKARQITVDQQLQYNNEQRSLSDYYARARSVGKLRLGPEMPELDFRHMPTTPIRFASSKTSAGLELVDVYLWIMKRVHNGHPLASQLHPIFERVLRRGRYDDLSLDSIQRRWTPWFKGHMKREMTDEDWRRAYEFRAMDEERRSNAMAKLGIKPMSTDPADLVNCSPEPTAARGSARP